MESSPQATPEQNRLVLWVIWGAMAGSIVIYLVVLQTSGATAESATEDSMLPKILGGVSVVCALLSITIRKCVTIPTVKAATAETIMRAMPTCIVSWALAEFSAVCGLVVGLMGYPMSTYGPFFIVSFATLMFLTPNFRGLVGQDAS